MFVVVGTTTVDLLINGLDGIPAPGDDEFTSESLVFLDDPMPITVGGNGANAAYALAGLGEPTRLCSVVGTDPLGEIVLRWLHGRGVGTQGMRDDLGNATPTTVVLTGRAMHRLAFHHPGGSREYGPQHLPDLSVGGGDTLLLTSYHLLPGFRGKAGAALLEGAVESGASTALDIGPALGEIAGMPELEELLPLVDVVFANRYELARCTGEDEVEGGAAAMLDAGAGAVVVKGGRDGASAFTEYGRVDVPGFPVQVRSTVGAGDAFDAGVLHALDHGGSEVEALRFGNAVAALVVSSDRGILGAPSRERVEAFLRGR
jgi:sugar/nucleoside kinase (ribokinase family)